MICPNCKCEYVSGATECNDCGVALVKALDPEPPAISESSPIVAVWRGSDPAEQERVEEALDSAGIAFTAPEPKSAFGFLAAEPTMEVWVSKADLERARKIVDDLDDRAHPDESNVDEDDDSLALPDSDDAEDDETQPPSDLAEEWYDDDPVAEVWCGDSEAFADNLIACLREVGIASRKLPESPRWRLVVRPAQEPRAKEIVREVVDASPPE
jgi:hypothetical protein